MTFLLAFSSNVYAQQALYGDVNGDLEINIADINAVIEVILDGTCFTTAADVNDDGEINIVDINTVIDIIFSGAEVKEDDFVDLGLPSGTLWATRNVGASRPEDFGDYFAWGETEPKDYYFVSTYKWSNRGFTKYCTDSHDGSDGFVDGKTELDPEDDAACAHYPDGRMPSDEQILELCNNCSKQWIQRHGVNGQLFTGPNGNTLFLPAAGYRWESSSNYAGSRGYYWSRTLYPFTCRYAVSLHIDSGEWYYENHYYRYGGFTVRAVRVSQN